MFQRILITCFLLCFTEVVCVANEADPKGVEFFENKIRPLLVEKCYKCHSADSEKLKGALRLDTQVGMRAGGQSCSPAVTPGDPDKSLLVKAIRWVDEDLQMPPKEKLKAEQIASFEAWIKMGAPGPRTAVAEGKVISAGTHWAYQPIRDAPPPDVMQKDWDWAATPIDAFILQKLEEKHLLPSPPADKRTLLRRATYDLTGLPPTPEEIDAFLADTSQCAFWTGCWRRRATANVGGATAWTSCAMERATAMSRIIFGRMRGITATT